MSSNDSPSSENRSSAPTIRRYEPSDGDAVWLIHEAALRAVENFTYVTGPHDADLRNVESVYLDGSGEFLVADLSPSVPTDVPPDLDGVVGCCGFRERDDGLAELVRLRVHPTAQGNGVARALVSAVEERARDRGYERMVLETAWDFDRARAFYETAGYEELWRECFGWGQECYFEKVL